MLSQNVDLNHITTTEAATGILGGLLWSKSHVWSTCAGIYIQHIPLSILILDRL
jgi:hypothetical protein